MSTVSIQISTYITLIKGILLQDRSCNIVDFGNKLKELRKQSGLTQQQIADRIGVTKSVISFYELKERSPSPEVLIKLSQIFHVSTDYLLGIDKSKTVDVSGLDEDIKAIQLKKLFQKGIYVDININNYYYEEIIKDIGENDKYDIIVIFKDNQMERKINTVFFGI